MAQTSPEARDLCDNKMLFSMLSILLSIGSIIESSIHTDLTKLGVHSSEFILFVVATVLFAFIIILAAQMYVDAQRLKQAIMNGSLRKGQVIRTWPNGLLFVATLILTTVYNSMSLGAIHSPF